MTDGSRQGESERLDQAQEGVEEPVGIVGRADGDGVVNVVDHLVLPTTTGVAAAAIKAGVAETGSRGNLCPEQPRYGR